MRQNGLSIETDEVALLAILLYLVSNLSYCCNSVVDGEHGSQCGCAVLLFMIALLVLLVLEELAKLLSKD